MVFSEVVGTLSFLQPQCDDDMSDRLHYYYTTTFLLVTAVLISLKMFGGRPIECWMPAEYQSSWQEYTEIYCFSMNTYFASFAKQIPMEPEDRETNMIAYYQWTPFFLVICAFLFYSPCLIWRMLYTKSGIRLKDIVAFATDETNIQPKMREANMKGMSAHLGSIFRHRFCWRNSRMSLRQRIHRLLNLRFYEAYLTMLYMGIKTLFLVNVVTQVFLMNWFLQTDAYTYYGWGVLKDLFHGRPWSDSGNFPRVTYCDMDIRILGNVQKHTVQCVLVINIFTEKFMVFVMLWVWYSFLAIVSFTSLISWIMSSFPFEARKQFIARRLELADIKFKRENFNEELDEFVRDFIKMDGVFVLRMLTIHAGILVCTEIVDEMWEEFRNRTRRPTRINTATLSSVVDIEMNKPDDDADEGVSIAAMRPSIAPIVSGGTKRKVSVIVPLLSQHHEAIPQYSAPATVGGGRCESSIESLGFLMPPTSGVHNKSVGTCSSAARVPSAVTTDSSAGGGHYNPCMSGDDICNFTPSSTVGSLATGHRRVSLKTPPNQPHWRVQQPVRRGCVGGTGSTPCGNASSGSLTEIRENRGGGVRPLIRKPLSSLAFSGLSALTSAATAASAHCSGGASTSKHDRLRRGASLQSSNGNPSAKESLFEGNATVCDDGETESDDNMNDDNESEVDEGRRCRKRTASSEPQTRGNGEGGDDKT